MLREAAKRVGPLALRLREGAKLKHVYAGHGGREDSVSTYYAGGLPIKSRQPTSVTNVACRECNWPPCRIHTYTVYTPIGGKGRCHTSCDLQDRSMQTRKSAGEISTLVLKPMRKDTKSKTGVISGSTKWTLVQTKKFKKRKKKLKCGWGR